MNQQSPPAARNIVVFSDGTGNSAAKLFRTNVWRLYKALDLADPANPAEPRQFAFYDDGVGTSGLKPFALAGGAFGFGLARNVRDLYEFICRTYRPGDRIYAFGFSRGAFTIRVLVDMLLEHGVVAYDGREATLRKNVATVHRIYLQKYPALIPRMFRAVRSLFGLSRQLPPMVDAPGPDGGTGVRVQFLGVWDTVDAYGFPLDEIADIVDRIFWPLKMVDYKLGARVEVARHALALDDERRTFHPRLWNERKSGEVGRIKQVWFAGAHSNVGGGYASDSLAHVSLIWMLGETEGSGLRFLKEEILLLERAADENGRLYDSRKGLAGYYRYKPRNVETLSFNAGISRAKVHESVLRRIAVGHDGYAPFVLPAEFDVVRVGGTSGSTSIESSAQYLSLTEAQRDWLRTHQQNSWNWVWWRKLVYFCTLGLTLALMTMPAWTEARGTCASSWCALGGPIESFGAFLPDFLTRIWLRTYASYPGTFLALLVLTIGGLLTGTSLSTLVRDRMRPVWYSLDRTRARLVRPPGQPSRINMALQRLRSGRAFPYFYLALNGWLKIFAAAMVATVGLLAILLTARAAATGWDSWGRDCDSQWPLQTATDSFMRGNSLRTSAICKSTGFSVEAGKEYRLHLVVTESETWEDDGISATPLGVTPGDEVAAMRWSGIMKRSRDRPWMTPILRVGRKGTDSYTPVPIEVRRNDKNKEYALHFFPRASGELFLYVNDVVRLPGVRQFYKNNTGSAQVFLRLLGSQEPSVPQELILPVTTR